MTPTLFALVLTVSLINGEYQQLTLGFYISEQECILAAEEQRVPNECWPVSGAVEIPAQEISRK